jgi:hypothetical protein
MASPQRAGPAGREALRRAFYNKSEEKGRDFSKKGLDFLV